MECGRRCNPNLPCSPKPYYCFLEKTTPCHSPTLARPCSSPCREHKRRVVGPRKYPSDHLKDLCCKPRGGCADSGQEFWAAKAINACPSGTKRGHNPPCNEQKERPHCKHQTSSLADCFTQSPARNRRPSCKCKSQPRERKCCCSSNCPDCTGATRPSLKTVSCPGSSTELCPPRPRARHNAGQSGRCCTPELKRRVPVAGTCSLTKPPGSCRPMYGSHKFCQCLSAQRRLSCAGRRSGNAATLSPERIDSTERVSRDECCPKAYCQTAALLHCRGIASSVCQRSNPCQRPCNSNYLQWRHRMNLCLGKERNRESQTPAEWLECRESSIEEAESRKLTQTPAEWDDQDLDYSSENTSEMSFDNQLKVAEIMLQSAAPNRNEEND